MPLFLDNFDLGFFKDSETIFCGLLQDVVSGGTKIVGYYGIPYFNRHYGNVQLIARTDLRKDGKNLEITGLDSHLAGRAVWTVKLGGMNINCRDADRLTRRVAVNRLDGGGMAVVSLVNADVLPSFMENEVIRFQVVGFPELIEYFRDEDEYAEAQPSTKDGRSFLLEEGAVFPSGLLRNRNPNGSEFETNEHLDDIMHIRGRAKSIYYGTIELDGESQQPFLKCMIDTQYGELEIVHCINQVKEEQRNNIREGAIVDFYGTLSGDVAIYEYEKGVVHDEEHNLRALRDVLAGGDAERIRSILSGEAEYFVGCRKERFNGADAIIAQLKHIQEMQTGEQFAHMATISDTEGETEYGKGKRCVVHAAGKTNNYQSIAFLDLDENGNISRLATSDDPRYHFRIDE